MRKSGYKDVAIKNWPRTAHLRDYAEVLMESRKAKAKGIVRQPWMDDFVQSQTSRRVVIAG